MNEKLYQVALEFIPGVGDVNAKNLIAYCGSAREIFKAKSTLLQKIPGIGTKTIALLKSKQPLAEAEAVIAKCDKLDIAIHHFTDASYPRLLKQAIDAPSLIYSKGDISNINRPVGVVGTRQATEYGKSMTEAFVRGSKPLNVTIISGLAYGIDITAHREALNERVRTIGVLAGGLDKIYPSVHKKYAEEMLETGGLISENPPGTKPEAHYFPARNRIIAGMSEAILVIEAAKKGGALITAQIADSYDKVVFAVPGDLVHKYSEGCNFLIRNQKALIYTGVSDLKYHLNWDSENNTSSKKPDRDFSTLPEDDQTILQTLTKHKDGLAIDELSWRTQITINQLAGKLLNLEFTGYVKSLPGKRYKIV
ncbi:MAG: DNA-processing protein DprA [Cyclobacteriaceae bacterium]